MQTFLQVIYKDFYSKKYATSEGQRGSQFPKKMSKKREDSILKLKLFILTCKIKITNKSNNT